MMKTLLLPFSTVLLCLGLLFGSATTLSSCKSADPIGLQNATNLSTRLATLMNKATNSSYASNQTEIDGVTVDLAKAEQHSVNQKRNQEIAQQWKILRYEQIDPFLTRWKDAQLDKNFVREAVAQMQNSLNAIKKAEQSKK